MADELSAATRLSVLFRTVDPDRVVALRGCTWTGYADRSLQGFDLCELAVDTAGTAAPTRGRMPVARGEIAAGDLGFELGDVVTVSAIAGSELAVLVVGLVGGAWLTGWSTTRSRMPLPSEVR